MVRRRLQALPGRERARNILAGTSIETKKEYPALRAKAGKPRERIRPELSAVARRESADKTSRGPESYGTDPPVAVQLWVKASLKDPDSYQHERCGPVAPEGAYWTVKCSYRARNSFGGVVLEAQRFFIRGGDGPGGVGQVIRADSVL